MFPVGTPLASVSLPCTAVISFPPFMSVPSSDVGNGRGSFRYFASSGHLPRQARSSWEERPISSGALRPRSAGGGRLKGLEEGEPFGVHPDLVHQGDEPGRRVAVERHLVVVGEFGEHDSPG